VGQLAGFFLFRLPEPVTDRSLESIMEEAFHVTRSRVEDTDSGEPREPTLRRRARQLVDHPQIMWAQVQEVLDRRKRGVDAAPQENEGDILGFENDRPPLGLEESDDDDDEDAGEDQWFIGIDFDDMDDDVDYGYAEEDVNDANEEAADFGMVPVRRRGAEPEYKHFSDPLFPLQWHLINPSSGNDINVTGVWAQGIFGEGVVVSVVDDGIDFLHDDLAANYVSPFFFFFFFTAFSLTTCTVISPP